MTNHLLVSLMFLLVTELASPYVVAENYSVEDTKFGDFSDQLSDMDDVHDKGFPKGPLDEMSSLDKVVDKNSSEELALKQDPPSIKIQAMRLAKGVCNIRVPRRYRKQERKSALRKNYQSFQHGEKSLISDEKRREAIRSEKCSACVLNRLCRRASVLKELGIARNSPGADKKCKRKIIKRAIDLKPKKRKKIECLPNARFRTIDGSCNNLNNPSFGAVGTEFTRITEADYADGISKPRRSMFGKPLPNARQVSRTVHGSNENRTNPNSKTLTHLTMNWGQFMDHDFSLAEAQGLNCEPPADKKNDECFNIRIPRGDRVFLAKDTDFIEVERDAPHEPHSSCKLAIRQHSNSITAYMDASNVYGSTPALAEELRAPDGLLRVMKHPHGCKFKNLLPRRTDGSFCPSRDKNRDCFVTGDERNNENQGLNSIHTLFVRQHNRIATYFGKKTNWDPERIYQETRKIIGAQLQYITYNEFLPLILSEHTIKAFGLNLLKGRRFFRGYNLTVNAQISTIFAVASYRFGHSLVQEVFNRFSQEDFEHKCTKCNKDKSVFLPIPVRDFNNPQYLFDSCKGGIDSILRGLMKDPAGKADGRFSSSVQEHLMRGEGDDADLVAINIQRSRDRGVPGYTRYRNLALCNLKRVNSFNDLIKVAGFDPTDVANLRKLYKRVEDIDVFTGGMLEGRDTKGGVLGPTFQCLIAEQLRRLKIGDRFWHENAPNATLNTTRTAFTRCQLEEIRKTLLSKIICENGDTITAVPKLALRQSSIRVDCDDLPEGSLEPWISGCKSPSVRHDADDEHQEEHDEF